MRLLLLAFWCGLSVMCSHDSVTAPSAPRVEPTLTPPAPVVVVYPDPACRYYQQVGRHFYCVDPCDPRVFRCH